MGRARGAVYHTWCRMSLDVVAREWLVLLVVVVHVLEVVRPETRLAQRLWEGLQVVPVVLEVPLGLLVPEVALRPELHVSLAQQALEVQHVVPVVPSGSTATPACAAVHSGKR